jgi:hypothetical protein
MFACGVRRMKRIASEDIAEMMAMPPRYSSTAVSSSARPTAVPSSSEGPMIGGIRAAMRSGSMPGIDEETVAPEHDGCFDSFALSNRSHEIPDACHLYSSRQVVAKLEIVISEVKR